MGPGTDGQTEAEPAVSGNGSAPPAPASDDTPSDMVIGDDAIVEMEFMSDASDDLDLDAQDLAPYDEIEDDTATPGFADAATLPAAAVPIAAAQAIVPGLAPKPVRQMTLQHGDEAIATKPASSAAAGDPGARLGRNDPCYCGSGLKYKKCHGK